MTVPVQDPVANHIGNGVTTAFAFGFKLLDEDDLTVSVAGVLKTLGIDYTIAGVGVESGGTVTFSVAPIALAVIDLVREVPINRLTDYQYSGEFESDVVNQDFDRIVMMLQDSGLALANAVRLPPGDPASGVLPSAAERALKGMAFDADGDIFLTTAAGDANALAVQLASPATALLGGGMVGYDAGNTYAAGTVGAALEIAATDASAAVAAASAAQGTADAATTNINTFKTDVASATDVAKGTALMGHKLNAAGSVGRTLAAKLAERVSVKDFGAVGDGVANDTAAIQAAITYIQGLGGGSVFFPTGTYQINAALDVTVAGVTIEGAGRNASILRQSTNGTKILNVTAQHFGLWGMGFTYTAATPSAGATAIDLQSASLSVLDNFHIGKAHIGVNVTGGSSCKFTNFDINLFESSALALTLTNDNFFHNFICNASTAAGALGGIRMTEFCEANMFELGDLLGGAYNLVTDSTVNGNGQRPAYCRFTNVYFDSSTNGSLVENMAQSVFTGCWWSAATRAAATLA